MWRGQPHRAAQRNREEEILHGINTSKTSKSAPTTKQLYGPALSTPGGVPTISEVKSGKSKGETAREKHWPQLPQHKGTGGRVTVDISAIKLSMPEKTPEKPWANLFATNHIASRGMNLT